MQKDALEFECLKRLCLVFFNCCYYKKIYLKSQGLFSFYPLIGRQEHATKCPGETSFISGTALLHSSTAYMHLVWKWQPEGTCMGLGSSP